MSIARLTAAAILGVLLAGGASASQISSLPLPARDVANTQGPIGYDVDGLAMPAAGQSFVPGAGQTVLRGFSLFLGQPDTAAFEGEPNAATALQVVGTVVLASDPNAPLFTSAPVPIDTALISDDNGFYQEFAFSLNLNVLPGETYLAFLAVLDPATGAASSTFGMPVVEDRIAGMFMYRYEGVWYPGNGGEDASFLATFDDPRPDVTVPAPGALGVFAMGLAGLALARRRRRA
ncbi:hypothetical protein [Falsiroseomonas oryzae]|uniref:hypothetical protein n=1 Tax=Falsiroseomonas oryzae TaxID=2766473 RepID=UPI0022EA2032|nr:hypothetical protein [Roseomonas sp. MO-31]